MGAPTPEARMRLRAGERFIEQARQAEGEGEVEKALAFYRQVGATYYVDRAEALLRRSAYSDSA